jgi:imidazolonepropionase-like amidohydrolase
MPSNPIYIVHVTVIDIETGKETQDQTVIIAGDRISELQDSKSAKPLANAKVVEGRGKFLIPGLWDMHVHAVFAERLDSMFPMFVANGVLGIRDMGTSMPLADIDHLRPTDRKRFPAWTPHRCRWANPRWTPEAATGKFSCYHHA